MGNIPIEAGDHARFVWRKMSPNRLGAQQYVKLRRVFNQLHGGVLIDIHVREFQYRRDTFSRH